MYMPFQGVAKNFFHVSVQEHTILAQWIEFRDEICNKHNLFFDFKLFIVIVHIFVDEEL
jgi:hypothetical protein